MIDKEIVEKRVKTYYRRLNIFRCSTAIIAIALYIIGSFNIEFLYLIDERTTIVGGLVLTAVITLTYIMNHDKRVNYYVWKIRK